MSETALILDSKQELLGITGGKADIANILYLRGLMEKLGRCCVMIRKVREEYGMRPHVWRADANTGFTLTFHAPEPTTEVTMEVTTEVKAILTTITGEISVPDKPQSRMQRYRLTKLGRQVLAMSGGNA